MAKTMKETLEFETVDDAVSYLYDNPGFDGEIRVLEREDEPSPRNLTDRDERSHNPDLPVQQDDPKHRCLYLLNENKADCPERMFSNYDLCLLTILNDFEPSPATATLVKAGYANERKDGHRSYYYITEQGKRLLRNHLGVPASEVAAKNALDF